MKIGILTYHRSLNYGAELQALALMNYLCGLGHDASIIDYWPEYRTRFWQETFSLPFAQMLKTVELRAMTCVRYCVRKRNSEKFIHRYMKLTPVSDQYDVVIYGSDQIWRKYNKKAMKGFDVMYWGSDDIKAKHRVSYAASMGTIKILKEQDKEFISEHLKNFEALSFREQDLIDYCKINFNVEIAKVFDPVFLLTRSQWNSFLPDKKVPSYDYILYYTITNNRALGKIVNQVQQETGLPVIELRGSLMEFHYGSRFRFTADAQEFLSLLRNASYVFASSFHGVALSLRFNREFYYMGDDKSVNRIQSLLSEVGLQNRIVGKGQSIDVNQKIDWPIVNRKLESVELFSKEWLAKTLSQF